MPHCSVVFEAVTCLNTFLDSIYSTLAAGWHLYLEVDATTADNVVDAIGFTF